MRRPLPHAPAAALSRRTRQRKRRRRGTSRRRREETRRGTAPRDGRSAARPRASSLRTTRSVTQPRPRCMLVGETVRALELAPWEGSIGGCTMHRSGYSSPPFELIRMLTHGITSGRRRRRRSRFGRASRGETGAMRRRWHSWCLVCGRGSEPDIKSGLVACCTLVCNAWEGGDDFFWICLSTEGWCEWEVMDHFATESLGSVLPCGSRYH
jgi:hypothetical protein